MTDRDRQDFNGWWADHGHAAGPFDIWQAALRLAAERRAQEEPVAWRLRKESGSYMYANTEAFLLINGCPPPEALILRDKEQQ